MPDEPRVGIDDVFLSLPAVVGRTGVERTIPLRLSPDEEAALRQSAGVLRRTIGELGL